MVILQRSVWKSHLQSSSAYVPRIPYYIVEEVFQNSAIKALVSYGGMRFTTLSKSPTTLPPQLLHVSGPEMPRRGSFSAFPELSVGTPVSGTVKTYRYEDAEANSRWVLPSEEEYHKRNAGIAHTRSLTFLKPLLKGPFFDLEAYVQPINTVCLINMLTLYRVWEEHTKFEFGERDVEKTMATMVNDPYVNHIPTMTCVFFTHLLPRSHS